MGKGIVIVSILGIIAIGVIAGLYFFFEKPVQQIEALTYINLSITAFDNSTKEPLEANYAILLESNTIPASSGRTLKEGFILDYVTANRTYRVFASAPGYYSTSIERFSQAGSTIQRTDLFLEPVGNLTISQLGELRKDTNLNLTLSAQGLVKGLQFCTVWSTRILTLNAIGNFSQFAVFPVYASQYDKCYSTGMSLKDSNLTIALELRRFGELESEDFIRTVVIDSDTLYASTTPAAFEGSKDIGLPNLVYSLK